MGPLSVFGAAPSDRSKPLSIKHLAWLEHWTRSATFVGSGPYGLRGHGPLPARDGRWPLLVDPKFWNPRSVTTKSKKYIAWDGRTYHWPPPKGWYIDGDQRWWAPGTGPGPATTPMTEPARTGSVGEAASLPEDESHTNAFRYRRFPEPADSDNVDEGEWFPPRPERRPPETLVADEHPRVRRPARGAEYPSLITESRSSAATRFSRPRSLVLLGTIMVLLLVILFGTQSVLSRRSTSLEAGQAPTSTTISRSANATTTAAGSKSEKLEPAETSSTVNSVTHSSGGGVSAPKASDEPNLETSRSSVVEEESTTTASSVTVLTDRPLSTVENLDRKINQYRTLLTAQGVTSDQLTNDDVVNFGDSSCAYAIIAQNRREYVSARDTLIESIDNKELSTHQLRFAIDSAVAVFCPSEAQRISLEP